MNKFKELFWSDEHSQNHTVILVTILAAVAIISMISPNFFTYRNFVSILEQSALYLILAIGMTLIMVTGGIDVGAKFEVYKLMLDLAAQGISIIFLSTEHEEILSLSDRIIIVNKGRIREVLTPDKTSVEDIHALAAL